MAAAAAGDGLSLERALDCFDRAIALREPLLESGDPWYGFNLAGSWMNRAQVLGQLGGAVRLDSALSAYDRALALLRDLPRGGDPRFRERLALAYLNRGTMLVQRARAGDLPEALRSFDSAIGGAEAEVSEGPPSTRLIAASARANRADLRARLGARTSARTDAVRAMAAVAGQERADPAAARVGLKARLALCACAAPDLACARAERTDLTWVPLFEALEAGEDGIALSARWAGDPTLAVLRLELIRFCAQVYARFQPQFLVEFLREQGRGAQPVVGAALAEAARRLINDGIKSVERAEIESTLATLREIREAAGAHP